MGEYDRQIATAKRLIAKKGQSVTWRKIVPGTPPDADKPWEAGEDVETNYTVNMVFLPDNKQNNELRTNYRGTDIPVGHLVAYLPAQTEFEPDIKDMIIRGSTEYKIIAIDPIAPNDQTIMYEMRLVA